MRRRPRSEEIIDWEELESPPNTRGAYSFLRSPSPVVIIDEHRPRESASTDGELRTQDKTSTVDITSPVLEPSDGAGRANGKTGRRPYVIHRCFRAQDGHSPGENQLYGVLWHQGVSDGPDSKRITMGHIRLSHAANLSDKAVKRCLAQLVDKLAIEILADEVSASRTGHTYRVHSFKSILERRDAAGLRFVVRDKGVRFVPDPMTGSCDDGRAAASTTLDKTSTVDITTPVTQDITTPDTPDKSSPDTGDKTSPPLGSSLGINNRKTTTTSEDLSQVVAALMAYVVADHRAARQIVCDSRKVCQDASLEEIAKVIHLRAPAIIRNPAIKNRLGLLVRAVPLSFEESGVLQLRACWSAEKERELVAEREREEQRLEMAAWVDRTRLKLEKELADPSTTEAKRQTVARQLERFSGTDRN